MRKAFTLIELLVVIAIIAILAAILFPVFAQAKAAAKKTQSLSNVKNLGLGHIMYSSDQDDVYCALQLYVALPPATTGCAKQIKWGDAIYPYIKNGGGTVWQESYDLNDGIFMSPSAKKQSGGSYAMHQDVFMDGAAPWTGCALDADFRVFSQTQIDNIADKVMMVERGNSGGPWAFLQFSTWRWDWGVNGYNRTAGTITSDDEMDVNADGTGYFRGDCEGTPSGGQDVWATCSMFPRYRYSNATPMAFFDGHAKTFSRGARNGTSRASSQISWLRNIVVPEAIRPSWTWY